MFSIMRQRLTPSPVSAFATLYALQAVTQTIRIRTHDHFIAGRFWNDDYLITLGINPRSKSACFARRLSTSGSSLNWITCGNDGPPAPMQVDLVATCSLC